MDGTETRNSNRRNRNVLLPIFCILAVVLVFTVGYGLGYMTNGKTAVSDDQFANLKSVYYLLMNKFYYGENTEEYSDKLIEDAIKGMVDAQNDPHTEYMTSQELNDFSSSLESTFVGIGVTYTVPDGNVLVTDVIRYSPAETAGIEPGDIITAVDGVKCVDIDSNDIPAYIKGEEGTKVKLTITRDGSEIEIVVIRGVVSNTVDSKLKGNGIGVLEISSFSTGTSEEVGKHLAYLKENNVTKLIIDLRDNGGGYVSTLDGISSYFMKDNDIIMREEYRDGTEYIDYNKANKQHYEYDSIVILINGNSASCSEVFTMAMVENCNAITVGVTSYGKGVAQVSSIFADGSALKYTDVIWKSGQGVYIGDHEGITPIYEVRLDDAMYQPYLILEEDESYSYDSVSDYVKRAQVMLKFLGYDVDRTDGYFSSATSSSLKKFQKEQSLDEDGILDEEVASALNAAVIKQYSFNLDVYDTQMKKAIELLSK